MRSGPRTCLSASSSASGNEFIRFSDVSQLTVAKLHTIIAADARAPTTSDSATRRRTARPIRSHPAAIISPAAMRIPAMSTTSSRTRPCWNSATIAVGVYPAARSHQPPCTAAMKLIIQVPTVTPSVTIAAVEGCSVIAAAAAASAIVRPASRKLPPPTVVNSGR